MTRGRIARTAVSVASLSFGAIAIGIWVAPDMAARLVGVESVRAAGTSMLRSDFGGLFAGLAVLCGAAAWTRSRTWILAAATMLAAIVTGRTLGWISGGVGGDVVEMAIELGLIAALVTYARAIDPPASTPAPVSRRGRVWHYAAAAAVVAVVGSVAAVLSPAGTERIFAAAAQQLSATNTAPLADDALRVAICGSSAPLPSAKRAKACVAVFAGGRFYIVDVGPESVENLVLWGIPLAQVGGVMLTHFHSDHIGDLGELNLQTWAGGRKEPMSVYGGPGVERVVNGFNEAYRADQGYRTAHHTEKIMPSAPWPMVAVTVELDGSPSPAKDRRALVFDDGALRVTAFEVNHAPIEPAYAYRFDYKGRSVVISGDLKYHPPMIAASKHADLLVSEAIATNMTRALGEAATEASRANTAVIMHDIEDYHITPEQAAGMANDANVKHLAFYHLLPSPDGALPQRLFSQGINAVRKGDWSLANDGRLYTMPIGTTEIRLGEMGR